MDSQGDQNYPGRQTHQHLRVFLFALLHAHCKATRARLCSAVDSEFHHLPTDEQSSRQFVLAAQVSR